jgi:integrase
VIVPRLGHRAIGSLTAHDILKLDRDLLDTGLAEASVANYLKPLRGLCEYAALKYNLPNPFHQVPRGRLSSCNQTREHSEWTTDKVLHPIEEGHKLDTRKEARADYGLAIEFKLRTGGRLGEVLGCRYGDIDFEQSLWTVPGPRRPGGARRACERYLRTGEGYRQEHGRERSSTARANGRITRD